MINWLVGLLPWEIWAAIVAVLVVAAGYLLGWKGSLAVIAAGLPFLAYRKGQSDGAAGARTAELAKEAVAAQQRKDLENEIDHLSPADLDARLSKWVPGQPKR